MDLRSGTAQLQLALLPPAARPPPAALPTVIRHGEFRRLLRQIVRDYHSASSAPPRPTCLRCRRESGTGQRAPGWSRPAQADHAELAALEAAERVVANERRRHGGPSRVAPPLAGRFVGGRRSSGTIPSSISRRFAWRRTPNSVSRVRTTQPSWCSLAHPVPKAYQKCCVKCKMKCSHLKLTLKML